MPDAVPSGFEAAYAAWRRRVDGDSRLSLSSRTSDYTDLPEYEAIVRLGRGALPGVMQKIEQGDWLLNDAAFKIAGVRYEDIVPTAEKPYFSEQEVAQYLLDWWRGQQVAPT